MSTLRILQELPRLFRYADVQKFSGNANVFLDRALKRELIERLTRGVYINSGIKGVPRLEEAACFIRTPCYISCEWALNHHGITIQAPTVCTVLTLSTAVGETRTVLYRGVGIEFSRIAERLFTGFTMEEGFSIATPEKALLDTIYFRKSLPVRDELELEGVDGSLLLRMAEVFPKRVRDKVQLLMGDK
jgi:predicted transcriptional regulator of viral defense system